MHYSVQVASTITRVLRGTSPGSLFWNSRGKPPSGAGQQDKSPQHDGDGHDSDVHSVRRKVAAGQAATEAARALAGSSVIHLGRLRIPLSRRLNLTATR